MEVSVIVPVRNSIEWIDDCLESILNQTAIGTISLEVCVYDDVSTDGSYLKLESWKKTFETEGIPMKLSRNTELEPGGVGYAKNRCIEQSSGEYLCFLDSDDVMKPERIEKQLKAASQYKDAIIGCQFSRHPYNSTLRYTRWANSLPPEKLEVQVLTSHGPTVIMPTWFCHRSVYDRVGGFTEVRKSHPEDLVFFYKHLDLGGHIRRVDEVLLIYRYHPGAMTFGISEKTIWSLRVKRLEENFILNWKSFYIWNAGKQGRQLYRSISEISRKKVKGFCDVDARKIAQGYYTFEAEKQIPRPKIPIVHFNDGEPPFVICVKLDMTNGELERNIEGLGLVENVDYVIFS
ncbi:queuosine-tRNA galactosyltransferase-like isoform X4 [Artemia franciscana]|uniref:queuosine-tRNA galactosyltransferase-like isoform X4 n=1 Tax=Artemia franciscana TaxID=6661 RepID=UPI0032DAF3B7